MRFTCAGSGKAVPNALARSDRKWGSALLWFSTCHARLRPEPMWRTAGYERRLAKLSHTIPRVRRSGSRSDIYAFRERSPLLAFVAVCKHVSDDTNVIQKSCIKTGVIKIPRKICIRIQFCDTRLSPLIPLDTSPHFVKMPVNQWKRYDFVGSSHFHSHGRGHWFKSNVAQ